MLTELFESCWNRAVPFTSGGGADSRGVADFSDRERELLALMISGATDERAGRQLKTSPRTVRRRINDLMRRVGAETRAQLAYLAAKEGWL
jgi:DNA-binding NarL/FixJ family response regulator